MTPEIHYLDTSFIIPYLVDEPMSPTVESYLQQLSSQHLLVSHWTRTELASALTKKARMGQLIMHGPKRILDLFDRLTGDQRVIGMVSVETQDFQSAVAWMLASEYPLRSPDALHLGIAQRLNAKLWTLDSTLAKAARSIRVEVGP